MNDRVAAGTSGIPLVEEAPFCIGDLAVSPPTLELEHGGRRQTLERRVMQVLVALARKPGEVVSREALMVAGWGTRVVGDDALHRCLVRIRRIGEETGAFGLENIRRVGYRLNPALPTAGDAGRAARPAGKPLLIGALLVLALAAAGASWRWSSPEPQPPRVAVAPFEGAGQAPALTALAHSITDATLSQAASQALIASPAAASARQDVVVSGLVSPDDKGFKATLHIRDGRSGAELWSGEARGSATTLPTRAAAAAVGELACGLDAYRRRIRLDEESKALFFTACEFIAGDAAQLDSQRTAARRLVERAPRFPEPLALLGMMNLRWAQTEPPAEARATLAESERLARRALALDPKLPMAHQVMGDTRPWSAWADRESWFLKGLAATPDAFPLHARLLLLMRNVGRFEDAHRHGARAAQLAPYAPRITLALAETDRDFGRAGEARALEARGERLWPDNPMMSGVRFSAAVSDDPARALSILADPARRPPTFTDKQARAIQSFLRYRLGAATRRDAVEAVTAAVDESRFATSETAETFIAELLALGEQQAAVRAIERLAARPEGVSTAVLFLPQAAELRRSPAFVQLAARLGLIDYWRSTGRWPDFCMGPRPEVDCRPFLSQDEAPARTGPTQASVAISG